MPLRYLNSPFASSPEKPSEQCSRSNSDSRSKMTEKELSVETQLSADASSVSVSVKFKETSKVSYFNPSRPPTHGSCMYWEIVQKLASACVVLESDNADPFRMPFLLSRGDHSTKSLFQSCLRKVMKSDCFPTSG